MILLFLLQALAALGAASGGAADMGPAPAAPEAAAGKDSRGQAATPPAVSISAEGKSESSANSPSVVKMLEGYEQELLMAAAIAVSFFVIGWICGGNYYLRRERRWRNKIRL